MLEGTLVSAAMKIYLWAVLRGKRNRRKGTVFVETVMVLMRVQDKDYVEDALVMRDEPLVSTLSNLFAHGCVVGY